MLGKEEPLKESPEEWLDQERSCSVAVFNPRPTWLGGTSHGLFLEGPCESCELVPRELNCVIREVGNPRLSRQGL